ncbi:P-loop containing nucleoside triphosphate hydrolase protein [Fistulina hepatica ATCC 64428]|uniref:p-loop containing nucleoside triphosphate hydrolase protein n=1 Tax=Fistulina hepatica ATCC 64428 TaxID=1128425 RepID=A0A0D7A0D5_9AGAR|nr:P-loop containing nucleoside triphosphate hydrolase protein [Fistulina hepatica ATCC 64428]
MATKVILVGVGGATCSGKTTLAKHLRNIIPDSIIIHQDPQEHIPNHPIYNVQDWDAPAGAIDWDRLVAFLRDVKRTGVIPDDHYSHDYLNEQYLVPPSDEAQDRWHSKFATLKAQRESSGQERVIFALVDGFLLYWHPDVRAQLDVQLLLRVPEDVLRQRRHERDGYHTAAGTLWRDPPHYWEQIVWPAYVEAHKHLFAGGDVKRGALLDDSILVLQPLEMSMDETVSRAADAILKFAAFDQQRKQQ